MHWENLPKVIHNEDAIREYERKESQRIVKLLKRVVWFVVPIAFMIVWLITH